MTVPFVRSFPSIGAPFTTEATSRATVEGAIARLTWRHVAGSFPLLPALAIKAAITELRLPDVRYVAISDELAPAFFYGIECRYSKGTARVYLVDSGLAITPVVSDWWPAALPPPGWELPNGA